MIYRKSTLSIEGDRGYVRNLGKDPSGKPVKFRLGHDEAAARLKAAKLETLLARACGGGVWSDEVMLYAKLVAKGTPVITLNQDPAWNDSTYAAKLAFAQELLDGIIKVTPATKEQREMVEGVHETNRAALAAVAKLLPTGNPTTPATLHNALDAYAQQLEAEGNSGWKLARAEQAKRLKDKAEDCPLNMLTIDRMEAMMKVWTDRPLVKGRNKRISVTTARNHLIQLRDFFRWLHRTSKFDWRRPDDLPRVRITRLPEDRKGVFQVETFSVEELATLYRHATPLVRAFILLAMNCGFSIAEVASLTKDEVHIHTAHPEAKRLGIASSKQDSWIIRHRGKTGIFGMWKLWDETVEALVPLMSKSKGKLAITTSEGTAYNAPTATGKKSSRVPNLWSNLLRTVAREGGKVHPLPFKMLRKTSGNMVRDIADGEIMAVFHSRGETVDSDSMSEVYSDRPWRKVIDATEKMREKLSPMF